MPTKYNRRIPRLVEQVILKAMAKNPDDRFQSIGEMMSELRLSQGFINTNGARPIISKGPYNFGTQKLQPIKEKDLPEDEPPEKKKNPFTRFMDSISNHSQKTIIIGMLGVFLVAFVWAFFSFGNFWSTEDITVPDVTGKQVEIAKKILKDKKLDVSVKEVESDEVPVGEVVSQTPSGGAVVKANRTIYLTVSKGNKGEEVLIPDLRSLTLDEAEKKLKEIGLSVGKVRYKESAQYADGTIIDQDPESPKKVEKGTKVDLVVCRKSEAEKEAEAAKNEAPNTSGMSLDAAVKAWKARATPSAAYPTSIRRRITLRPSLRVRRRKTARSSTCPLNIRRPRAARVRRRAVPAAPMAVPITRNRPGRPIMGPSISAYHPALPASMSRSSYPTTTARASSMTAARPVAITSPRASAARARRESKSISTIH